MMRQLAAALAVLTLTACGVKTGLDRPMGQMIQPQQQTLVNPRKDPSSPPTPLGSPGGRTSPYTIGP